MSNRSLKRWIGFDVETLNMTLRRDIEGMFQRHQNDNEVFVLMKG